jgi:hypothetical protein
MNRRSFFTKLGLAAASFAILPSATTYARHWVAPTTQRVLWVPNPAWVNAPYEVAYLSHITVPIFHDPTIHLPKCRFVRDTVGQLVQVPQFIKA